MKNIFLSNYKTTITGIAGLIVAILGAFGIVKDQSTLSMINNIAILVLGLAFTALGYFVPDADKVLTKLKEGENVVSKVTELLDNIKPPKETK
ncbi:MAG: hypothetical protein QXI16_00770 [Sulfolobaceae archaeon]